VEVASSTTRRKWKWLTMNGFVCNSVISAAMEFYTCARMGGDCVEKIAILNP